MVRPLAAALIVVVLARASPLAAQRAEIRAEVMGVGDTTVAFKPGEQKWLKAGMRVIAVDPRRRDVLVATLRVMSVRPERAEAVITGQTMPVTTDHVVILVPPRKPWYLQRPTWLSTLGGLIAGFALGKL
jgi:hypothetical protein